MMSQPVQTSTLGMADLAAAEKGSWYTILGVGGDPQEYVRGYEEMLVEQGIGKPKAWYKSTGADVNKYVGDDVLPRDQFQRSLNILVFPLDGMDVSKLAMFKLRMQDRWFDDVVGNMRRNRDERYDLYVLCE